MKRCNCHSSSAHVIAYASGTNRACDIRGVATAGIPIGVDVSKISESGISALLTSTVPLMLDSGAFGEVSMCGGRIVATSPINDAEWRRRLEIYLRISRSLCKRSKDAAFARVTVVAPDQVGSQEMTLRRLERFKSEVQAIKKAGAEVMVPLQRGGMDIVDFYLSASNVLGFKAIPAIPMKKAACSPDEIVRFLQRTRVPRIHLLGIGLANTNAEHLLRRMQAVVADLQISVDSNRIRAAVGQNRPISIGERQYLDDFAESWSGEVDLREWGGLSYDMTELLFSPSYWLAQSADVVEFTNSLTWLSHSARRRFADDPDAFLRENDTDEWLAERLTEAYIEFIRKQARPAARTKAVATTLSSRR
jgi:hypothetical protein